MEQTGDQILNNYMQRLSGVNDYGDAKASVIYQMFALEDEEDSVRKKTIYNLAKAKVNVVRSKTTPQFIRMDIVFSSYDNTELKLLWSRLKQFEKLQAANPDQTFAFHFNLTEVRSVIEKDFDGILVGHFINPVMSYLTRETPTTISDEKLVNGELLGGNVVRMLFAADLVTFELVKGEDINLTQIESDVEAELVGETFVDSYDSEQKGVGDF